MDIILSNTSEKPIYQQIKEQLMEQILNGTLREGEQLPSIRGLAKELQISVITTKRAYEELENEGYINSVPGKGSFVSQGNKQLLAEKQFDAVRSQLRELVEQGKMVKITQEQLIQWIKELYKED